MKNNKKEVIIDSCEWANKKIFMPDIKEVVEFDCNSTTYEKTFCSAWALNSFVNKKIPNNYGIDFNLLNIENFKGVLNLKIDNNII